MTLIRREFLRLTAGALALPAVSRVASAQTYPSRPVRILLGFAPGGPNDITARLIAQWLSDHLGQQFFVENRPGAASNIAVEALVRSPADGYTLIMVGATSATNASLYDNLSFDFIRDTVPVAGILRVPNIVEVPPSFEVKTVPELIAYAKANPGKINHASAGIGTPGHLAGELFKMMAGVNMVHVPYRGSGPALTDLIGGQVQLAFDAMPSSIGYVTGGRLRALAVTTATRSERLPDIPTVSEFIPGYEASSWFGLCAPKNTPAEIVNKINATVNAGLADPELKKRFADLGASVLAGSSDDFGRLVVAETEKWGKVIRAIGLKSQ